MHDREMSYVGIENSVGTTMQEPAGKQDIVQGADQEDEVVTISVENVYKYLMKNYGVEKSEAEQILGIYAETFKEDFLLLQRAVENRDGEEAAARAHALKGSCLNIGQTQLADTAYLLERELPEKIESRHLILMQQLNLILQPIIDLENYPETDIQV